MKIVGVILATFAVGFVAFQNCQQAPHPNDIVATDATVSQTGLNKTDLQGEKIADIGFNFQETESVTRASGTYSIIVNKNLNVELPSGEMTLTSDMDATRARYCLTETLANELVSILKSSQVCRASAAVNAGQVCAQVVQLPYAVLTTEKESYALGSATDGCGNNAVDLCGEQVAILKGFFATVKAHYKSFICP